MWIKIKEFLRKVVRYCIVTVVVAFGFAIFGYGMWVGKIAYTPEVAPAVPVSFVENKTTIDTVFKEVAEEEHIPLVLLLAVADQESGLDMTNTMRGGVGELGLMQIRPDVWLKFLGHKHWSEIFGPNVEAVKKNVRGGARILAYCLERARNLEKGLVYYNCGETCDKKPKDVQAMALAYSRSVQSRINKIQLAMLNQELKGS